MADEEEPGTIGSWQSLLVNFTEEEEVSRMAYVTYSRHVAMRRVGDRLEFAHIWTAGNQSLDQGYRGDGPILSLPVRSRAGALDELDDLTAIVAGIRQSRAVVVSAFAPTDEGARE